MVALTTPSGGIEVGVSLVPYLVLRLVPFVIGLVARRPPAIVLGVLLWPVVWLVADPPADHPGEGMWLSELVPLTVLAVVLTVVGLFVGRGILGPPHRRNL